MSDANSGTPVENALVEIVEAGELDATDNKGEWRVEDLEPGTYTVRIRAAGYQLFEQTGIKLEKDKDIVKNFTLISLSVPVK